MRAIFRSDDITFSGAGYEFMKPIIKTLSVTGIEYDHNANQELPEIIGEWFDLNNTEIIGYKAGDCT